MADFAVRIVRIDQPVEAHPNANRLSIVRIGGYLCISAKLSDGSHRYRQGDLVAYIPEAAVLPKPILIEMGFWKDGKGTLAGANGNRVKAMTLRGVLSQGVLYPIEKGPDGYFIKVPVLDAADDICGYRKVNVSEGQDVAGLLGIEKYVPPVPQGMAGDAIPLFGVPKKFDFESIQAIPDLFEPGEPVHVTEKLHGTMIQIGYVPDLNHRECFFDGCMYVSSKGFGNSGLVFKDKNFSPPPPMSQPWQWLHDFGVSMGILAPRPEVECIANEKTLYVTIVRNLISNGLGDNLKAQALTVGQPVRLFGEVFGRGVQDLHYGQKVPTLRIFDVMIGDHFLPPADAFKLAHTLGLETVPVLYEGPYDTDAIEKVRDGKDSISNSNVREGVVIRSATGTRHPLHGRKIGKWVSPNYLTRKGAGEEFQ